MTIPLHHQLLAWRSELAQRRQVAWHKRVAMKLAGWLFTYPWLYRLAGRSGRWALRWLPHGLTHHSLNAWARDRELPRPPKRSFRDEYRCLVEGGKGGLVEDANQTRPDVARGPAPRE